MQFANDMLGLISLNQIYYTSLEILNLFLAHLTNLGTLLQVMACSLHMQHAIT